MFMGGYGSKKSEPSNNISQWLCYVRPIPTPDLAWPLLCTAVHCSNMSRVVLAGLVSLYLAVRGGGPVCLILAQTSGAGAFL